MSLDNRSNNKRRLFDCNGKIAKKHFCKIDFRNEIASQEPCQQASRKKKEFSRLLCPCDKMRYLYKEAEILLVLANDCIPLLYRPRRHRGFVLPDPPVLQPVDPGSHLLYAQYRHMRRNRLPNSLPFDIDV